MQAEARNSRWRLTNKNYSGSWTIILDFWFPLLSHDIEISLNAFVDIENKFIAVGILQLQAEILVFLVYMWAVFLDF